VLPAILYFAPLLDFDEEDRLILVVEHNHVVFHFQILLLCGFEECFDV